MTPRRRRIAAVGVGLTAAAAAVTANLVLLGQARSEDPMGRLSPALDAGLGPSRTATGTGATAAVTAPAAPAATTESPPRDDHDDDDRGDEDEGRDHDDD